ncbi:MAG: ABC transporter ATP-binding protein [Calditrichaeota bacterium]|nr:ABC transporter ATP-binding protein [Calditrichota bacterium]
MNQRKPAIVAEHLTRRFGTFLAVDRVSFRVYEGEIFGFLGANGAGKTTVIRMLCGLLAPSDGNAWTAGFNVRTQVEQIKQHIGYMSQKFSLYEDLTVRENLAFYGGLYHLRRDQIQQKKQQLFQQLELAAFETTLARDLPLGFKQRLALSCALLHDPPVLFLDEPTSGVDPRARRDFWGLIQSLARSGKTIFVTTHFMEEAEYCHRVAIMHEGKIVAMDTPETLKARSRKSSMQQVFVSLIQQQLTES